MGAWAARPKPWTNRGRAGEASHSQSEVAARREALLPSVRPVERSRHGLRLVGEVVALLLQLLLMLLCETRRTRLR